jgi:hypothetical protein
MVMRHALSSKAIAFFFICVFALSVSAVATAQTAASAVNKSVPAKAAPKVVWQDVLPQKPDETSGKIATTVLKDDIAYDLQHQAQIYTSFFNAPGLDKDSLIITYVKSPGSCGDWGCDTYLLKKTSAQKNTWTISFHGPISRIITSPELTARIPGFYTLTSEKGGYSLFNAKTGKFELTK